MAMPKGGTKAKTPTNLMVMAGADKKHPERLNKREPKRITRGIPPPPPYLLPDEQESWLRFAQVLDSSMGVMTKEDFAAFEALVCTWEEVKRLRQALRDDPRITVSEPKCNKAGEVVGEVVKARPEWSLLNTADSRLMQWLGRFGLTPGDRGRVQDLDGAEPPGAQKNNPDREFGAA